MTDSWVYVTLFMNINNPKSATLKFFGARNDALAELVSDQHNGPNSRRAVFHWDELPEWVHHKIAALHTLPREDKEAAPLVKYVDGVGGVLNDGTMWIDYDDDPEFRRSIATRQEQLHSELGIDPEEYL